MQVVTGVVTLVGRSQFATQKIDGGGQLILGVSSTTRIVTEYFVFLVDLSLNGRLLIDSTVWIANTLISATTRIAGNMNSQVRVTGNVFVDNVNQNIFEQPVTIIVTTTGSWAWRSGSFSGSGLSFQVFGVMKVVDLTKIAFGWREDNWFSNRTEFICVMEIYFLVTQRL
jgi:hypothetical protein